MTPRQFAIKVVNKLQAAGYQALWAGGCVRDQLLGSDPKDYDVATSAHPDEIRQLFGHHTTLPIGAAFGVITVLGPKSAGQIEVATFRRDSGYSDGRRPDSVEFTDAREDAIRRDFTINGMFYDPIADLVIDYVGGQLDLNNRLVRAIGNPHERIEEDKLRMLRGIRFAASFEFELESDTWTAIKTHASEISAVSPERIGAELIRMLSHGNKTAAAKRLLKSGLLTEVLPSDWPACDSWSNAVWAQRFAELATLLSSTFEPAAFLLLRSFFEDGQQKIGNLASQLQSAWRLTNHQRDNIAWIGNHWQTLVAAQTRHWSEIQPLLVHPNAAAALDVATAIVKPTAGIKYCLERLSWPPEQLNPPPFLDGKDLIELGISPGPQFKDLLQSIRDQQLDGEIQSVELAKQFVKRQI